MGEISWISNYNGWNQINGFIVNNCVLLFLQVCFKVNAFMIWTLFYVSKCSRVCLVREEWVMYVSWIFRACANMLLL